jgi:signal transduction histidine kinase
MNEQRMNETRTGKERPAAERTDETRVKEKRAERAARAEKRGGARRFFSHIADAVFFFPRLAGRALGRIFRHFKLRITVKTTITYAVIFTSVFAVAGALITLLFHRSLLNGGMTEGDASFEAVRLIILTAAIYPIALALTVALGHYASRGMLKPIRKMIDTTQTIDPESLSVRLSEGDSEDELTELAAMINRMLDSIQVVIEQQKRFVSDASHELRTPISVVQGYSGLLKRWGSDNPEILHEAVDAINSESANMKNLVDKLLFLARADKKTIMLTYENFYVNELAEEIVRETRMYIADRTIGIGRIRAVNIDADREMVKQAIRVFVDNAIKYTENDGAVLVNCFQESGMCVLEVCDNGIGISQKDLPHVFERFYRCDTARTRDGSSTGLGLSIAKWIADSHGGEIQVDSQVGKGTQFRLLLPIRNS